MIFGTLYIASVADVVLSELMRAFSSVEIIRGDLVVDSNPTIVSLESFGRLGRVDNVFISNNPSLVDARLPLATFDGGVYVSNNVRLCPSYWPDVNATGGGSNGQKCAYVDMTQLVSVSGTGNMTSAAIVAAVSSALSSWISVVCIFTCSIAD